MDAYEITVDCHLSDRIERGLDGWTVVNLPSGQAVLTSRPLDQAALHGILARLRDLNIGIVSVHRTKRIRDEQTTRRMP